MTMAHYIFLFLVYGVKSPMETRSPSHHITQLNSNSANKIKISHIFSVALYQLFFSFESRIHSHIHWGTGVTALGASGGPQWGV